MRTAREVATLGLFDILPEQERAALARCARTVRLTRGSYLYHEQMPGDSLHIVVTGRMGIWSGGERGRPTLVNTIGPSEMFGELAVLSSTNVRIASAQALTDVTVLQFDRRDIQGVLERRPRAYLLFVDLLSQRVQRLTNQLAEYADLDGPTRIYRHLCRLADTGEPTGRQTTLDLAQHHLASLAGVSLRLTSDVLTAGRAAGLLRTGRGEITVLDWPGVRRKAGLTRRRQS